MELFLSWSKSKSKELALSTRNFLQGMFRNSIKIWMSSESIPYGSMFQGEINAALQRSEKCIAFITADNYKAPWIMYEVGAISKNCIQGNNKNAIIPIMFDKIDKNLLYGNPLDQFQQVKFRKEEIKKLIIEINETVNEFPDRETLVSQFELNWVHYEREINAVLQKHSVTSAAPVTCSFLIDALNKAYFPAPDSGTVIKYENGFETQKFYSVLLENVDKRFWVFGRKNKKLFSADNRGFFSDLERRKNNGFDFKCLFIDPTNEENLEHAQRGVCFKDRLRVCINEASEQLSNNGIDPADVCRFYSCTRSEQIFIVDNVVIYSHVLCDEEGFPFPLTGAPFCVVDIESPIGKKYYQAFTKVWNEDARLFANI